MAISGDPKFLWSLASHPKNPLRSSLSSSSSKLCFSGSTRASRDLSMAPKRRHMESQGHSTHGGIMANRKPSSSDVEGLLVNAINMRFFDRLALAWRILFPSPAARKDSNANIAKQRLKMILFSDRCAVSDEAKGKIVRSIIESLSEFVEIDPVDKVQLDVSADPDFGTVCSVTVPVRRVKPEYHDSNEDYKGRIASIEYKDTGESSGTVDVRFDFFVPDEK